MERDRGNTEAHQERKFIVFESRLFRLFERCSSCHSCDVVIKERVIGTFISITQECNSCSCRTATWESQPYYGCIPAGNLLLSASTLFAGGSCTTMLRILQFMKIAATSEKTFYNHQSAILQPAIERQFKQHMRDLVKNLQTFFQNFEVVMIVPKLSLWRNELKKNDLGELPLVTSFVK